MAIADFEVELTNETTFSQAVEDEPEHVTPGGLVFELAFEEGEFLAVEPYTGMFGEGETEIDAVRDLLDGLKALRALLTEKREVLSEQLANRLDFLQSI